jgi:hypothetical protein
MGEMGTGMALNLQGCYSWVANFIEMVVQASTKNSIHTKDTKLTTKQSQETINPKSTTIPNPNTDSTTQGNLSTPILLIIHHSCCQEESQTYKLSKKT